MQTVSNMQRIGINNKSVELLLWLFIIVIYESLVTVYPYFPPLFGLMMAYLWAKDDEKTFFLIFLALLFFEANHSLLIFSTWLFAWMFIKFIMPLAEENIVCRKCLHVFAASASYIGFYFFITIFNFLLGVNNEGFEYAIVFYYILMESILVLVLL